MARFPRPTVSVSVRIGVQARELLEQVAKVRKLSMSGLIEQLVVEESQRLGPPKKRQARDE